MSLTSPRLIAPFLVTSLAALGFVSCSQLNSPSAPSSVTAPTALQSMVTEYVEILADDTPVPTGSGELRLFDDDDPPERPSPGSWPPDWPPGPPPKAGEGKKTPIPPSTHPKVGSKVDPLPVHHSGTRIQTSGCRDNPYTWFYDQYIHNETGVPFTIIGRENYFDHRHVNTNNERMAVAANGTVVLRTRWCSGVPRAHFAQTKYKIAFEGGVDIDYAGPYVPMLAP